MASSSPGLPGPGGGPTDSATAPASATASPRAWTVVEPCGQPGACPYTALGGAVLLAPPAALPLLGTNSSSGSYGDAMRITPVTQPPLPTLLARLHPLLPGASPCECGRRSNDDAVVVLPRSVVVTLPSPSGVDVGGAREPLPPMFQAGIEPVLSSGSSNAPRRKSFGASPSSSSSSKNSSIPIASSIGLTPIFPTPAQSVPLALLRSLLLHAAVTPGATLLLLCNNTDTQFQVTNCLPSGPTGSLSPKLVDPLHTRLALLPPPETAAGAKPTAAASSYPPPLASPAPSPPSAATALADGLLELLVGVCMREGPSPSSLAWLVPRGVLLSGPPGVGKTHAVREAARRAEAERGLRVHVQVINGGELEAEGNVEGSVRAAFARARAATTTDGGAEWDAALLFLDEMEALCPAGSEAAAGGGGAPSFPSSAAATRVVAQLGQCLDAATTINNSHPDPRILVVGATNRPHDIHPALRRPGRLDKEIVVPPPDAAARLAILHSLLLHTPDQADDPTTTMPWLPSVARDCVGYVAADLQALVREALVGTLHARNSQVAPAEGTVRLTEAALRGAMERVGASVLRGKGLDVPHVPWSAIGGQEEAKRRLQQALEWPLRYPKTIARFFAPASSSSQHDEEGGKKGDGALSATGSGILLYGPPGCAKTTLVKAAVSAVKGVSFLSLSSGDVYSVYVGDAEAAVRNAFALARQAAPCVLFFDELDAIVGSSTSSDDGDARGGGGGAEARVLSTFLNELDGVDAPAGGDGVVVVGATNLPDSLDPALLRPGRLSHLIEVRPPQSVEERLAVLEIHTRKMPLQQQQEEPSADPVDLRALAGRLGGYSGADIEGLCREAAMAALREDAPAVGTKHFALALEAVPPSLPPAE